MNSMAQLLEGHKDWMHGFCAYADGRPLTEMTTTEQRKGWRTARLGEGVCIATDAVFAEGGTAEDADRFIDSIDFKAELEDYEEDILDREYHSRGMW